MTLHHPREFGRPGTAEYVLGKSGLVRLEVGRDQDTIHPGEDLVRLFPENAMPELDQILPSLVNLVIAYAYEQSNFLDEKDIRTQAIHELKEAGMSDAGIKSIDAKIAAAAKLAQKETDFLSRYIS